MKFVTFEDVSIRADDVIAVTAYDNKVTIYLAHGPEFIRYFYDEREAEEAKMLVVTRLNRALK